MKTSSKNLTKAFARKNSNRSFGGFTIIEVLIVLAIAGLIMAIVFLAVPALQRNSRNSQIRTDASSVLGSVNEFAANNSGALPGYVCANTANGDVRVGTGAAPSGCATGGTLAGKVRAGTTVTSTTAASNASAVNTVVVNLGRKCNGINVDTATTPRAAAASFMIETGGTPTTQCVET